MRWWRSRRRRESELREEIEFDLYRETEENLRAGLDAEEARGAARRYFGNVTRAEESAREVWSTAWLRNFAQHFHFLLNQRGGRKFAVREIPSCGEVADSGVYLHLSEGK